MHFNRIRLIGFKSFIDSTDLLIEPGLTAIIGPNGCGKSNLVEGLRWAMGETSARKLRGREMDDVIFGGSETRPRRNHAEVSILLDNAARTAPAAYAEYPEIEVSRRIDRAEGSTFRINGREVRARDVQLLFADEATGARSTALVSQGEIGALISSRPAERRSLLDEAAGITGLHSRRHEAELRLRAADTNLERLDDVMAALDTQLQGLKRQARQAKRYRRVAERIRETEALLLYSRWRAAEDAVGAARETLAEARREVAGLEQAGAACATGQAEAAAALPPLREAEAKAGAALHRLEVAQVELEAEERRLADARRTLETRISQIESDVERERALAGDAEEAVARLEGERTALTAAQHGEQDAERSAGAAHEQAAAAVALLEGEVDALTTRLAEEEAKRAAVARRIEELDERMGRLRARLGDIETETSTLAGRDEAEAAITEAGTAVAAARARVEEKRAAVEAAERERETRQAAEAVAREGMQAAETGLAALRAEAAALAEVLGDGPAREWSAIIDKVTVEAGYETALGAALGDDLAASQDTGAPLHWREIGDGATPPSLPSGARPLSGFVSAPSALTRRLAQVGVVDADEGERLQASLEQGQRLVSRAGGLWRWDGFTIRAEADAPAAVRLQQKSRLTTLRTSIAADEAAKEATAERLGEAVEALRVAKEREATARTELRAASEALDAAGEARSKAAAEGTSAALRGASLHASSERLAADLAEAGESHAAAVASRDALEPDVEGRTDLDTRRADLVDRRTELAERSHAHDRLRREAAARRDRIAAISGELESWRTRAAGATDRLAQLAGRRGEAQADLDSLAGRPAEIAGQRDRLLDQLGLARDDRDRAADAVAEAEATLTAADRKLKEAEAAVAAAREQRVRAEGAVQQTEVTREDVGRAISERIGCPPSGLAAVAGIEEDADLPDPEETEARLARLRRERENIGAVNLRAEAEAEEVDQQLTVMRDERADLEAAIARLRHGIARLNREGRERLETAFKTIDGHFQKLFSRMFGGGRAYLTLVDSDDPLEAGLEIMASPPGKRLQVLSLLSGGEQALTAISLLFAVFLTNPAPICVLDEVDAPLDDANVERFCDLIDEIAHSTATRFIVITHHHLTMARMDRLFGVTMSERGVSQLVSVDLRGAEALRATG